MARTALPLSGIGAPLLAEGPLYLAPAVPGTSTAASGGTVLAGTYLVCVSFVTPLGETSPSPIASQVTAGTTSTLTINSPTGAPLGPAAPNFSAYTGWYAYVTQLGGTSFTRQQAAGSPTPIGTNLTLTAPPTSTGIAPIFTDPAGTTIDAVNGMQINLTTETIPPGYDAMRGLLLRVKNTTATAQNVIIRQGIYPPSMRAFLGDLTVNLPPSGTYWIGPLDAGRHSIQDTTVAPTALEVNIDFQSGTTGTITAFAIPRNVPGNP
jgi:hypothetical protein